MLEKIRKNAGKYLKTLDKMRANYIYKYINNFFMDC